MLDIDIEPFKGILFVRLSGKLDRRNIKKLNIEVVNFLKVVGIKNIVFNIDKLTYIDKYGKRAIINSLKISRANRGQSFICVGENKKIVDDMPKKIKIVKDELTALNLINS